MKDEQTKYWDAEEPDLFYEEEENPLRRESYLDSDTTEIPTEEVDALAEESEEGFEDVILYAGEEYEPELSEGAVYAEAEVFDGEIVYEETPESFEEEEYSEEYSGDYPDEVEEGAEAFDGEYAADDADTADAEYFSEEAYASEDTYAGEDSFSDEEVFYEDVTGVEMESEDGAYSTEEVPEKKGLRQLLKNMDGLERFTIFGGLAVLLLALLAGGVFFLRQQILKRVTPSLPNPEEITDNTATEAPATYHLGDALVNIDVVGQTGLQAYYEARLKELQQQEAIAALEQEQEEFAGYGEAEIDDTVKVSMESISVLKDLKIKFTNSATKKLVGNVPFTVTATTPEGKLVSWTDDDQDGIIYKKGLDVGEYKIHVETIGGERYEKYGFPADKTVEVKGEIVYEAVEVADEIVTVAEVNEAAEDTGHGAAAEEEPVVADTVEWVESTAVTQNYIEVEKTSVADPMSYTPITNDATELVGTAGSEATEASGTSGSAETTPIVGAGVLSEEDAEIVLVGEPGEDAPLELPEDSPLAPTAEPTEVPATTPSEATEEPAAEPTLNPSENPENNPYAEPTAAPEDTASPTTSPEVTAEPTTEPTNGPLEEPSTGPTAETTKAPEASPLASPEASDGPSPSPAASAEPVTLKGTTTAIITYVGETAATGISITGAAYDTLLTTCGDASVATVSLVKGKLSVTGVSEGKTTIKITTSADSELSLSYDVTVKLSPKTDTTTRLVDTAGHDLLVKDGETYRNAFYADYYNFERFYRQGDVSYTGWQHLGGCTYYYKADGTKVTGEQIIQGVKYSFSEEGALSTGDAVLGIDVSKWNGTIDWNKVKESGISFVIIRVGYRGSSKGVLIDDAQFVTNIRGAEAAGLKVGVYFFSQAVDEAEALYEASMVLERISGFQISYPIFLDIEPSGGRGDQIDKATRTAVCKTFCETIRKAGYTSGIYANKTWLAEKIDVSQLGGYKIWLAQYAVEPTYQGRYEMWQYSAKGTVNGISGEVDLDVSYLGY